MASLLRGLTAPALIAASAVAVTPAWAQTDDGLAAARKTFAQAVADQNAERYQAALEEFRQVASTKETANVRYRIASCLESLGRRADALASYKVAMRLGDGDPAATDAVRESRERAAELDRTVPRLGIAFSTPAPPGTEVRVDDAPVDLAAIGTPIRLDAGSHTVTATAPGAPPFRTSVTLLEGSGVTLAVDLAPPQAPEVATSAGPTSTPAGADRVPSSSSAPVGGYVALGIGGALAASSVVSLVLRASNMGTLSSACTSVGGDTLSCPPDRKNELKSAHDAAALEGPLAIGLGVGAAVAIGVGVWLIVTSPSHEGPQSASPGLRLEPTLIRRGGGLVLSGVL